MDGRRAIRIVREWSKRYPLKLQSPHVDLYSVKKKFRVAIFLLDPILLRTPRNVHRERECWCCLHSASSPTLSLI